MIRVLWLSVTSGFYEKDRSSYNGGGWVGSLLQQIENTEGIEIGFVFLTSTPKSVKKQERTTYYPIYAPPLTGLRKLRYYYGHFKTKQSTVRLEEIQNVINDFHPDVIHLFGMENQMAEILGNTSIPVVAHLQGLLAPCNNAFWPSGFNKTDFLWPFSINEWILRNGYIFAKNSLHVRAKHERELFRRLQYAMGRTVWDKLYTAQMAPMAHYYHVDEMLRSVFYEHTGKWKKEALSQIKIISTVSNTIYKGLDIILKTAKQLKECGTIPFEWRVAGINHEAKIVRFFERKLNIKSSDVNVTYLGVLSADNLCKEELEASVYVHPSYIDNSPNSLCEAQLLGVPCISTNVGGTSSLIEHEKDGILVPANAPYELAYYIKEIANSKEWSEKLSKAGVLTASARHNKDKIVKELLKCYNSVINLHC